MTQPVEISQIKAVILDVDGVLTDGRVGYGGTDDEIKFFDVQDGLGITLLQKAGLKVGVLSGRASKANRRRFRELGLSFAVEGCRNKAEGFAELVQQEGLEPCQCLYMGDDLVDIPAMSRAGIAVAVANAPEDVRRVAHWVCEKKGGRGAVREVAERVLKALELWEKVTARYYD